MEIVISDAKGTMWVQLEKTRLQ